MVHIERIIRKMKQGGTGPYLCVGDDGNYYIVKGPNTTYSGLIHEWVGGTLGKIIGLPVPDFKIAYVDSSLLKYGDYELYEGDWFASKYEKNIQDVPYGRLDRLDPDILKLLFLFDYWIKNGDRNLTENGGNPNLFIRSDLKTFIVLDHNLAFDKEQDGAFNEDLKKLHVSAGVWFGEQRSLFDQDTYTQLLTKCFDRLDSTLDTIPKVWLEKCEDNDVLEGIRVVLSRFKTQEFWETIK